MDIQFETFIVSRLSPQFQNIFVTTVFNDAFRKYLDNPNSHIEFWLEGEQIETYVTIDDFVSAGRVIKG